MAPDTPGVYEADHSKANDKLRGTIADNGIKTSAGAATSRENLVSSCILTRRCLAVPVLTLLGTQFGKLALHGAGCGLRDFAISDVPVDFEHKPPPIVLRHQREAALHQHGIP